MARLLTVDEIYLLKPVFKNTLKYHSITCTINKLNIGGKDNSITPAGVAYFSQNVYCEDFSSADANSQWIFVHEMTHVWQWQHGRYPLNEAIGLAIKLGKKYMTDAYPYDLMPGKKLEDYNLEQQASIVADYWGLYTKKLLSRDNKNPGATLGDYSEVIAQLQQSGTPTPEMNRIPI